MISKRKHQPPLHTFYVIRFAGRVRTQAEGKTDHRHPPQRHEGRGAGRDPKTEVVLSSMTLVTEIEKLESYEHRNKPPSTFPGERDSNHGLCSS